MESYGYFERFDIFHKLNWYEMLPNTNCFELPNWNNTFFSAVLHLDRFFRYDRSYQYVIMWLCNMDLLSAI